MSQLFNKTNKIGTVNTVCEKLRDHRDSITVPIVFENLNELKNRLEDLINNDPEFFYIQSISFYASLHSAIIKPVYIYSKNETNDIRSMCENQAKKIIRKAEGFSEYEKACIIHDVLARNISYHNDGKNDRHTIVGPLIERKAVCDGYSKAYSYVLSRIGLENIVVRGTATNPALAIEESHAWNMIKLNGNWCHIDVTFDSTLSDDFQRHDYFGLSDRMISADHQYNKTVYPHADKSGMDYYSVNGCLMVGRESFRKCIISGLDENKSAIPIKLPDNVPNNNLLEKVSRTLQDVLLAKGSSINYTIDYNLAQRVFIIRFIN